MSAPYPNAHARRHRGPARLRARPRRRTAREVIELKRRRRVAIGPIVSVVFENRETMRSQIQEMARAERMVSDEQIQKELDVYNALIPEPGELSATLFIELTGDEALRDWLPRLVGIEHAVVLRLPGRPGASTRRAVDGLGGGEVVRAEPEAAHEEALTRARDHGLGPLHPVRPRPRPGGALRRPVR